VPCYRSLDTGPRFVVGVLLSAARFSSAQLPPPRVVSSLDVSATNVWYADTIRSNGVSIMPAVRLDWTRATLGGSASITHLARGGTSAQVSIAPSVFTPSWGAFTAELAGAFGGSAHEDGTRTGQTIAMTRVYAIGALYGAWAGGGIGRTWDGFVWRPVKQGEFGAWLNRGEMTGLVSLTPVVVEDTIRYADLQTALRYPTGRFELGVTGGTRAGASGPAVGGSSRAWGNVSALVWLSQRWAIVGSAGSYPVDLTQGYPGGRFLSVALRVASRNTREVQREEVSPRVTSGSGDTDENSATALAFEIRTPTARGTQRELRVHAPAAKMVEITGDFTGWQPVRLTRADGGWWTMVRTLARGTYQMNIRIDGGPWTVPPGLLTSRDEFGGTAAILTIE
jgi:hypothetical protein